VAHQVEYLDATSLDLLAAAGGCAESAVMKQNGEHGHTHQCPKEDDYDPGDQSGEPIPAAHRRQRGLWELNCSIWLYFASARFAVWHPRFLLGAWKLAGNTFGDFLINGACVDFCGVFWVEGWAEGPRTAAVILVRA
jgi:hypothetical protein